MDGHGTIMRQNPLQNHFFTQRLLLCTEHQIRNMGSFQIPNSVFLYSRTSQLLKKPRFCSISTQETTSKNKIWCGPGGVLFLGLFLFFKDVKLSPSTHTLTILLIYAAQFIFLITMSNGDGEPHSPSSLS